MAVPAPDRRPQPHARHRAGGLRWHELSDMGRSNIRPPILSDAPLRAGHSGGPMLRLRANPLLVHGPQQPGIDRSALAGRNREMPAQAHDPASVGIVQQAPEPTLGGGWRFEPSHASLLENPSRVGLIARNVAPRSLPPQETPYRKTQTRRARPPGSPPEAGTTRRISPRGRRLVTLGPRDCGAKKPQMWANTSRIVRSSRATPGIGGSGYWAA